MMKSLCLLLLFALFSTSQSRSSITLKPQANPNFNINTTNHLNARTCTYTVKIATSCSSTQYTNDQISLAFGDAYGNQVYAPRIDDPSSQTFKRCSLETFKLFEACTYDICYLYLYRSGHDGWKPERVDVRVSGMRVVSFNFNAWIPADVWYGFNYCPGNAARSATK